MNEKAAEGIDLATCVRKAPRIASRTIDGQAVVVQLDRQALHTLNSVGTRVFELSDGRSLNAILAVILDEFDVPEHTARADVARFAAELLAIGALERI